MVFLQSQKNKKRGFILVEMLVAVFLFTIVMLVSMTAVLALIDANRKNQGMKSVINNLNLVVNGMVKNLAVSRWYYCGIANVAYPGGGNSFFTGDNADCNKDNPNPARQDAMSSITFTFNKDTNGDGHLDVIRYRKSVGLSFEGEKVGNIERSIDGGVYVPITSPEVNVTDLKFYVFDTAPLNVSTSGGVTTGDTKQPRVVMVVRGYAGVKESLRTQFNIQTTISQRPLDTKYAP